MSKIIFDYEKSKPFIEVQAEETMKQLAEKAKETLVSKQGAGNRYKKG